MKSGKGLVEVRFSGNDSFDLKAKPPWAPSTIKRRLPEARFSRRQTPGIKVHQGSLRHRRQGLAKVELSSYSGTIRILKRD